MSLTPGVVQGPWASLENIRSVSALERQIHAEIEEDKFANYELMPLATEGLVTDGLQLFIPYFPEGAAGTGDATEDVVLGAAGGQWDNGSALTDITDFGLSRSAAQTGLPFGSDNDTPSLADFRTITLDDLHVPLIYYFDGFRMTKPVMRVAKRGVDMYDRGIERLSRYIAKTHEESLQRQFLLKANVEPIFNVKSTPSVAGGDYITSAQFGTSGYPMKVMPTGASAWQHDNSATPVVPTANRIGYIRNRLKRAPNNQPTFKSLGGNYAGIIGPDTEYQLLNHVESAGGIASITFEQESMNMADVYKTGKVPELFKIAMICSNAIPIWASHATLSPYDDADAEINMFFAPDAIYKCPSAALSPEVHVVPPVPSAADPTGNNALVSTDFAFASRRGPYFQKKAVVFPVPELA